MYLCEMDIIIYVANRTPCCQSWYESQSINGGGDLSFVYTEKRFSKELY